MAPQQISLVVLCGERLSNLNTAATLIEKGLNVVGICVCKQHLGGVPISYMKRSLKKRNLIKLLSQIAGRLYYNILNYTKDDKLYKEIFSSKHIKDILDRWNGHWFFTSSFSDDVTRKWLSTLNADIYVANTSAWIPRSIRVIPQANIIIGGHPGLIPYYRGSHSAFWAIYNGRPEDVGCSIFWLDEGVDTGDLIMQETLEIEKGDSHLSLSWKGLKREAQMQAEVLLNYCKGLSIPRQKHKMIPEGSEYGLPTLQEYMRYRKIQRNVR